MNCRIRNDAPTAAQRRALKKQVKVEFDALLEDYNYETALQVLHILHFDFGFGQTRLQRFADKLGEMQNRQKRYELPDDDLPWLCKRQLEESGIDVERIIKCDNK